MLGEVLKQAISVPASIDVRTGRDVYLYPLILPADAEFLLLLVSSDESAGLAVEMSEGGGEALRKWKSIATATGRQTSIALPIRTLAEAPGTKYRLRIWSADRQGKPVRILASVPVPSRISEQSLSSGINIDAVPGITPPIAIARVTPDRPDVFNVGGVRSSSSADVPCQETKGDLIAAGGVFWLVKDITTGKHVSSVRIDGSRFILSPGGDAGAALVLPEEKTVSLDMAVLNNGPVISVVTSSAGQPGIRLLERSEAQSFQPSGLAMAAGPGSAVSVSLSPREPMTALWSAGMADPSIASPFDVHVHSEELSAPDKGTLSIGVTNGSIKSRAARVFGLPEGRMLLHLVLGEGMVGVLSKDDVVTDVLLDGGKPHEEILPLEDRDVNRLTLLQPASGEGYFRAELLPQMQGENFVVGPGRTFEKEELETGILRLRVLSGPETAGAPTVLHVRGADTDPLLITANGRVSKGDNIPVPPGGGTLLVHHRPGLLLIWMDDIDGDAGDLWGGAGQPEAADQSLPARVPLAGKAQLLRLNISEPLVLHLRAATPAVTIVRHEAGPSDSKQEAVIELQPEGCSQEVYLPKGVAEIGFRALAGRSLYGEATLTATAATPIGEGSGPEVILPSGGARVFSFQVKRKGPVGIGVRAEADVIEATLLDSSGIKLGAGVVQMRVLEPGNYLLTLKAPAAGPPLRARPALAGVEPPPTGPPPEVIREYVEKAAKTDEADMTTERKNEATNQEGSHP